MGTKWEVPVLTQIILLLFEYINVKPRFYTREQVAQSVGRILVWFVLLEGQFTTFYTLVLF
jgi:hypothetical protein